MTETVTAPTGTVGTVPLSPVEPRPDLVVGADGLARPRWACVDPLVSDYYDREWGMPLTDERSMFELLALECFVGGLSWSVVLSKRAAMREAFDQFEPDAVAAYDQRDLARLLAERGIVRNRRKIEAVIANANATVALRADGGLVERVWSYQPATTPLPQRQSDVPLRSEDSERLADELHDRGFRLVGPVTMQALMAAAGVVDLHLVGSHRRGCSGLWTRTGRRRARPAL